MINQDLNEPVKSLGMIESYQGCGYLKAEINAASVTMVKKNVSLLGCYGQAIVPETETRSNDRGNKENTNTRRGRKPEIVCTLVRETNHYRMCFVKRDFLVNDELLSKGQTRILQNYDKVALLGESGLFFYFTYQSDQVNPQFPKSVVNDIHVTSIIGSGACGKAYLVTDIRTLAKYALKRSKKNRGDSKLGYSQEARIHLALDHPNIVKLLMVQNTPSASYLYTEYLNMRDILSIINGRADNRLEEEETRSCIFQVVQGVKYLHERNIAHRDIKCDNIFVQKIENDQYICKIGDFGLAAYDENLSDSLGTLYYSPPEIVLKEPNDVYNGKSCDIWSLGVSLYSLISGHFPFTGSDNTKISFVIKKAQLRFDKEVWKLISKEAKHLIGCMVSKDPTFRYKILEVEKHIWFMDSDVAKKYQLAFKMSLPPPKEAVKLKRKKPDFTNGDGPWCSTRSKKARVA